VYESWEIVQDEGEDFERKRKSSKRVEADLKEVLKMSSVQHEASG